MDEKDFDFVSDLVKKLQRDINAEFLNTNFTSPRQKQAFLKKVDEILAEYGAKINNESIKMLVDEWGLSVEEANKQLRKVPDEFFVLPNKDVLQTLLTLEAAKSQLDISLNALFIDSKIKLIQSLNLLESNVKRQVLAEIAAGSITGKPIDEIAKRVKEEFLKNNLTGFSFVNKNGVVVNNSIEAVARSTVQQSIINSRMQATVRQAVELGYDLVKVDKHANESPMCQRWGGKILSIAGLVKGYPLLNTAMFDGSYSRGGIGHRWCRHSLTIYIPTSIQFN